MILYSLLDRRVIGSEVVLVVALFATLRTFFPSSSASFVASYFRLSIIAFLSRESIYGLQRESNAMILSATISTHPTHSRYDETKILIVFTLC